MLGEPLVSWIFLRTGIIFSEFFPGTCFQSIITGKDHKNFSVRHTYIIFSQTARGFKVIRNYNQAYS